MKFLFLLMIPFSLIAAPFQKGDLIDANEIKLKTKSAVRGASCLLIGSYINTNTHLTLTSPAGSFAKLRLTSSQGDCDFLQEGTRVIDSSFAGGSYFDTFELQPGNYSIKFSAIGSYHAHHQLSAILVDDEIAIRSNSMYSDSSNSWADLMPYSEGSGPLIIDDAKNLSLGLRSHDLINKEIHLARANGYVYNQIIIKRRGEAPDVIPRTCKEAKEKLYKNKSGNLSSGIYELAPGYDGEKLDFYCEMDINGGGYQRFIKYRDSVNLEDICFSDPTCEGYVQNTLRNYSEILLTDCAGNEILNLIPDDNLKLWTSKIERDYDVGAFGLDVVPINSCYVANKVGGGTVYYGHNKAEVNLEFETMAFTSQCSQYSDLWTYSIWGAVDSGNSARDYHGTNSTTQRFASSSYLNEYICGYVR